jgi:alanyl-tRNA synthetase
MGQFSRELCGGTHLDNTSEVIALEIVAEEGVAAGTRRITALTGPKAQEYIDQTQDALTEIALLLGVGLREVPAATKRLAQHLRDLRKALTGGGKAPPDPPPVAKPTDWSFFYEHQVKATFREAVASLHADVDPLDTKRDLRDAAKVLNVAPFNASERVKAMLAEVNELKQQLANRGAAGALSADMLLSQAESIQGTTVIVAEAPSANANLLRQLIDQIRKKASPSAVFLATTEGENKVILVAGVSRELVAQGVSAGNWVRDVAPVVGGGGGGKPDLAQAGGKQPEKLPEALAKAKEVARTMLGA